MRNSKVTDTFLLVAATSILVTSSPVRAQNNGEFYVGGGVGIVLAGNTRADGVFESTGTILDGQRIGPEPGKTASGNFDPGFSPSLRVGYDMGERRFGRLRFEGELFFQQADAGKYTGELNGVELNPAGKTDTSSYGVVLSALYGVGEFGRMKPYIHLGLGQAQIEMSYNFQDLGQTDIDGSSQVISAGFGANFSFKKGSLIDLRYRFRRAGLNESGLDADIDAHILEAGIYYPL